MPPLSRIFSVSLSNLFMGTMMPLSSQAWLISREQNCGACEESIIGISSLCHAECKQESLASTLIYIHPLHILLLTQFRNHLRERLDCERRNLLEYHGDKGRILVRNKSLFDFQELNDACLEPLGSGWYAIVFTTQGCLSLRNFLLKTRLLLTNTALYHNGGHSLKVKATTRIAPARVFRIRIMTSQCTERRPTASSIPSCFAPPQTYSITTLEFLMTL